MKFRKYQHIEKLNTIETNGIESGLCYVFPKIDGTNGSIWLDNGEIKAGSRNRELTLDYDNAGFYEWVLNQQNIKDFFKHSIGSFCPTNDKYELCSYSPNTFTIFALRGLFSI